MSDNSNNRRKALVVSMLAFLFIGGGVFLFFIIQGSDDITGAGKKNSFAYGFSVRNTVLPLFRSLGLSAYEEEAVRPRIELEEKRLGLSAAASESADVSDWMANNSAGAPSASGSSYRGGATAVPKMAGRAGSGAGGSGGSSQSSGAASRFGDASNAGNTKVSAKVQGGADATAGKGTMGALKNARATLGEGLRSDSAMTARSKWGQSFGVEGSGGGGRSGDLAYAKSGLVGLDKIKSGEISNLKIDKKGSLKTTDVSPPVKDAEGTSEALSGDKKVKEDAEAKMKKDIAGTLVDSAGNALTKDDKKTPPDDRSGPGDAAGGDSGTCDANAGPQTELCSMALGKTFTPTDPADGKGDVGPPKYEKVGKDQYTLTYSGTGLGTTGDMRGQPNTPYSDVALVQMTDKGPVIIGWTIKEGAAAK